MAHVRQQAPTDPDSPGAVLALMIRPWAPAAVSEHVRLVLGDSECAARGAVWVEISYGLEGAPLTYLRHILQVDGWRCAEPIEQLLNGETPYATWRSGCPPALLMARTGGDDDAQGNPTYQVTLQLTVSGLTDGGPTRRLRHHVRPGPDQRRGTAALRRGVRPGVAPCAGAPLARYRPGQCSGGGGWLRGEQLQQPRQRGGL